MRRSRVRSPPRALFKIFTYPYSHAFQRFLRRCVGVSSYSFEARCGCLGCTEPKVDEIEIPGKGTRAVCEQHREQLEVNRDA